MESQEDKLDGRKALQDHVLERSRWAREKWGPDINDETMLRLLQDKDVVRYDTELVFDAGPLQPGEFAFAEPKGEHPGDGFRLCVHPWFEKQLEALPLLVAYHIVRINYGDVAGDEEAELFGATLLGLDPEEYYGSVCRLADTLPTPS